MTKLEFILELSEKLSDLPKGDVRERINFYSEMIEDRVEEGISEEDAVAAVGSVDEIAAQIKAELSSVCEEKAELLPVREENVKPKKHRIGAVEIILLVFGFPLWFPLLIAAASVVFSLYVSLWAVVVSFWAVFVSLAASAFGVLFAGGVLAFGSTLAGLAMIGAGLVLAGLSILSFLV